MLGLVACAFAARHFPDLDLGRVAQYALVHDLVEVYAGDTPTLRISAAQRLGKHEREMAALERIERELGDQLPWVAETIRSYEDRQDREARFVKALDKLLPAVTNIVNDGAELRRQGMGRDELGAWVAVQGVALLGYASDFPALLELRAELMRQVLATVQDGDAA
jgi:putative hydrolase of HD superfamily